METGIGLELDRVSGEGGEGLRYRDLGQGSDKGHIIGWLVLGFFEFYLPAAVSAVSDPGTA